MPGIGIKIIVLSCLLLANLPSAAQDSLTVISWNVFLRPGLMPDKQMKRVDSIAHWLKDSNSDILVLQEVFHNRARKKLISILEDTYPFYVGPGKGGLLKTNSGVMIFARDSLINLSIKRFKHAAGSDQLAYKSGVSCELTFAGHNIQIVGTHLQAGDGDKRHKIRQSQQKTLESLLYDNSDSSYVQILAGDFNTNRESYYYGQMLKILHSQTIEPKSEIRHTANNADNPLFNSKGNPQLIDYILLENHSKALIKNVTIHTPKANCSKQTKYLSDHNVVKACIVLP